MVSETWYYSALSQVLALLEEPELAMRREPLWAGEVSFAKFYAVRSGAARPGDA